LGSGGDKAAGRVRPSTSATKPGQGLSFACSRINLPASTPGIVRVCTTTAVEHGFSVPAYLRVARKLLRRLSTIDVTLVKTFFPHHRFASSLFVGATLLQSTPEAFTRRYCCSRPARTIISKMFGAAARGSKQKRSFDVDLRQVHRVVPVRAFLALLHVLLPAVFRFLFASSSCRPRHPQAVLPCLENRYICRCFCCPRRIIVMQAHTYMSSPVPPTRPGCTAATLTDSPNKRRQNPTRSNTMRSTNPHHAEQRGRAAGQANTATPLLNPTPHNFKKREIGRLSSCLSSHWLTSRVRHRSAAACGCVSPPLPTSSSCSE